MYTEDTKEGTIHLFILFSRVCRPMHKLQAYISYIKQSIHPTMTKYSEMVLGRYYRMQVRVCACVCVALFLSASPPPSLSLALSLSVFLSGTHTLSKIPSTVRWC